MVIHDEARIQTWTQDQERQNKEREKPQRKGRLSVLGVQSVACCVAVLLALLLRVAGGEAYESLRQHFHRALARNEWATVVALLWDEDPLAKAKTSEEVDVKQGDFTGAESARLTSSSVAVEAVPPLENGTLTSAFGERIHPINGSEEIHTGVDIAAPKGTSLVAMYDGEVVEVGENDTLGRYIRMNHGGGIQIVYGHCESVVARQGDAVKAGEEVALVGSTGVSTGSHVHLSVMMDGETCDPATLLSLEQYA